MNFGEIIKHEIINKPLKENHCKKAFLAGILRGASSLYYENDDLGLVAKISGEETAILVSSLFKSLFDYEVREVSVNEDKLNKKDVFSIYIGGENAIDILEQLEIITEKDGELSVNFNYFGSITQKECCLHAFIRGLFVAVGSCTVPDSSNKTTTGYHLELSFSRSDTASELINRLSLCGLFAKVTRRKDDFVLYIKSAEEIKDFLAFLPAPKSVLQLTDIIIKREFINDINRRKNCDLGNVNKQVEASSRLKLEIEKIQEKIGLDNISSQLKDVAIARIDNPEDSLSELADLLNISKSCLNHRLRKISDIASKL